jgi:hypothetical protein
VGKVTSIRPSGPPDLPDGVSEVSRDFRQGISSAFPCLASVSNLRFWFSVKAFVCVPKTLTGLCQQLAGFLGSNPPKAAARPSSFLETEVRMKWASFVLKNLT